MTDTWTELEHDRQIGRLRNEIDAKEEATLALVAAWLLARGQGGLARRIHPGHGDEVRIARTRGRHESFKHELNRKAADE